MGLAKEYKTNTEIGKFLKHFFGLPYLSPKLVKDCFLKHFVEVAPDSSKLTTFINYLQNNYINDTADFPPHLWAEPIHFHQQTTNACESFHSRFNDSFYTAHPNIFVFLKVLTDFQISTYIKINSLGNEKNVYRRATQEKIKHIQETIKQLNNNSITTKEFLNLLCYYNLPHTPP